MLQAGRILFVIVRYGVISAFLIAVIAPLKPFGMDFEAVTGFVEQFDFVSLPDPQVSAKQSVLNGAEHTYVADYEFAITKWSGCISSWFGEGRCGYSGDLLALTFLLVGLTFIAAIGEIRFALISLLNAIRKIPNQMYAHKIATALLAGYSVIYWHLYKLVLEGTQSAQVSFSNVHLIDEQAVYAGFLLTAGEAVYATMRHRFQSAHT